VEVQYRLASETLWHSVTVPGDSTFVYLIGANPGDVGFVQVRTKNRVAVSDWSTMIGHTVTGKAAGPGTPTGFTAVGIAQGIHLACTPPTDVDLAYLELWRNTSNTLGTATKIAWGMQTSYDDNNLTAANGTLYYWVRAVNTTGIAGSFAGPASAVAGLTTAPNPVTGLTATPIIGGIRLTCTLPTDADLASIQLFENTTNNSATATMIAQGLTDHYDRLGLLPSNGTRYYWVKCVNTSGTVGAFSNVASATAGQVATAQIASAAVGTAQLATGAVGSSQIASGGVATANIANAAVGSVQMTSNAATVPAQGTSSALQTMSTPSGVYVGATCTVTTGATAPSAIIVCAVGHFASIGSTSAETIQVVLVKNVSGTLTSVATFPVTVYGNMDFMVPIQYTDTAVAASSTFSYSIRFIASSSPLGLHFDASAISAIGSIR
jgi:hypothetical protein